MEAISINIIKLILYLILNFDIYKKLNIIRILSILKSIIKKYNTNMKRLNKELKSLQRN